MTCKDIMTPDPSCCLPSDSVAIAAQIMRRNDVGPVLVVSDHESNRLVGIVTDRDLALKVLADGRDPQLTRVDEVMSLHPVCCRETDSTARALELMAEDQVRRIPIVDENERLVGIVAQADVARSQDEEEVGRMVEQISEPYGSSNWAEVRSAASPWSGGGSFALGALCMGLGAGLMYVLDPTRGRTRQTRIKEKAASLYSTSADNLGSKLSHLKNRASGLAASTEQSGEAEVPDSKLEARIRSKMGRYVSHPRSIQVDVTNGHVVLSGPILADEVRSLIDCVNGVEGVRSLESRLDVHDHPGYHPALQSGRDASRYSEGGANPALLVLAGLAGSGLVFYGMRSRTEGGEEGSGLRIRRGETPGY